MSERTGSQGGYSATITGLGGPIEEVEAEIKRDEHVGSSEAAQLRLLREDLARREASLAKERESMAAQFAKEREVTTAAMAQERAAAAAHLAELRRSNQEIFEASRRQAGEAVAQIKELNQAITAMAGEAAGAAMAQIERAKQTAEIIHEYQKQPPSSALAEVGKHAVTVLGTIVQGVLAANPALAVKAGETMGAIVDSLAEKPDAPAEPVKPSKQVPASTPASDTTLGALAAARDLLTEEELAALCLRLGVSIEQLPAVELVKAAEKKGAAHAPN